VKRILLADDSAVVRKSLRYIFEADGWSICGEASDGREAIQKAWEVRPDIIILDLSMPVMNGLTAGHILKAIAPETPLILFTAFGRIVNNEDLKSAGFAALIDKNQAGQLVATARNLLQAA